MDRKCLLLSEHDTDEYVFTQAGLVGPKAALDANADVAADGAIVVTKTGDFGTARTDCDNAKLEAETAVTTKGTAKTAAIKAYNATAKKVDEKYTGAANEAHKEALGFDLSKVPASKGKCGKIAVGGTAVQWIHDGFSELDWPTLGDMADFYTIEEYTGDPAIETNWYPANPPQSKKASAIVKPKTLNVPTGWRITGNNAAGPGVAPSDPIGGKPIH